MSRRGFVGLLALGLAACTAPTTTDQKQAPGAAAPSPDAPGATGATTALPPIPAPVPGPASVVSHGPATANQIALTVDDGTCTDCVSGYVDFAVRTGTHLTFSPNGSYAHQWEPHAAALAPLLARGQVQIMNHTFSHPRLTRLPDTGVRAELERNEAWAQRVFGITTRPYYRPPYGLHDPRVDGIAAAQGWTRTVLWNGSLADSKTITPEFLMTQARRYLNPGTIVLGHANHPTVLGLFDQLLALIHDRNLHPVTLDEMFGTNRATGTG